LTGEHVFDMLFYPKHGSGGFMSRGRILLGIAVVVFGVIEWLDRIRGTNEAHAALAFFGKWWPVGLVALGAAFLAAYLRDRWWLWGPLLIMAAGLVALELNVRGTPSRASDFLLPAVLVGLGLVLAMTGSQTPDPQRLRYVAVLRGRRVSATASEIRQGNVGAYVGHLELDLTKGAALYDSKGELDVAAVLGRVEVLVPAGWEVERNRSVEFPPEPGASERKSSSDTAVSENLGAPHLTLYTTTIFGSIQVMPVQAATVTPTR
jgi:hypothetical protein